MIIDMDGGISWEEENNGREMSINYMGDQFWGGHIYYVAREPSKNFRKAGVVENLTGIANLMQWINGKDWNATGLIEGNKNRA
jgi:hypothetical protein